MMANQQPIALQGKGKGWKLSLEPGSSYADVSVYSVLMRRPEGKKPLGIPGHRWDDYIKVDLQEVGWGHGLY